MTAENKALTKAKIIAALSSETGIAKPDCQVIYEALGVIIDREIRTGPGEFKLLNLLKIDLKDVPAREAQYGVPNPFKPGEVMDLPAKPASKKVRVSALKGLRSMVD